MSMASAGPWRKRLRRTQHTNADNIDRRFCYDLRAAASIGIVAVTQATLVENGFAKRIKEAHSRRARH
jgi:hypothetical protein